jgi:hypothetical protein
LASGKFAKNGFTELLREKDVGAQRNRRAEFDEALLLVRRGALSCDVVMLCTLSRYSFARGIRSITDTLSCDPMRCRQLRMDFAI